MFIIFNVLSLNTSLTITELQSGPVSAGSRYVLDPVQEVADFGVNAVHVFSGAALPPAHHARQEPGLLVARRQRAAAVALARVLAAASPPSAEHVLGDVELRVEAALV